MADKKRGSYFNEHITKCPEIEYTDDDLSLTQAINTSRSVAALERQVKLYEEEIATVKRSVCIAMCSAIASAVIGIGTVVVTLISKVDLEELQSLLQQYMG